MLNLRHFPGRAWPLVLFGFVSVFWGNFGQSFFIGVYGESFKKAFNLNASQYGSLYSLATFLAGFLFLYFGAWVDRLSLKRVSFIVGLGLASACGMLGFAENPLLLFLGLLCLRLFGQSMLPHTGMVTMARVFDKNRGKALGIASSAIPVGEILLPLLALSLIVQVGWQVSWLYFAGVVLIVYMPLALVLLRRNFKAEEDPDPEPGSSVEEISGRFSLLKNTRFLLILPSVLYAPFIVTGVFIHQDYILYTKAWLPTQWAASFIAYGAVHWIASFVVGSLIDRYTAGKILAWFNLPVILALVVALLDASFFTVALFLSLLGVTIGFAGPLTAALWAELYGKKHLGGIRAMVTAFVVVSTAISPVLFGLVIDLNVALEKVIYFSIVLGLLATVSALKASGIKKREFIDNS